MGQDNLVTFNKSFKNVYILYPAIPLLGIHPIEIRVVHKHLWTRMFTAALLMKMDITKKKKENGYNLIYQDGIINYMILLIIKNPLIWDI